MAKKSKTVESLTGGIEYLFKKNKVDYLKGWGKFKDSQTLQVDLNAGGTEELKVKNVIIATGSEPSSLPKGMLDIDEEYVVSSTGALALKEIPKKMIVVGGGVIGLELGSVYNRLGSEVTVINNTEVVCPSADLEIAKNFQKILTKQGLKFKCGYNLKSGKNHREKGVEVVIDNGKGSETLTADVVLLSIGRRAFTQGLNLDKVGLTTDKQGKIKVDHHCKTDVAGIYAIGDIVHGPMLAHKAEEEGICAVENILGEGGHVNYASIPGVVYTHPELANVGLSEEQLKKEGIAYNVGTFPFSANSRARANGDVDGMVKILSCKKTDKILGAWILGANAGEMIHELVLAAEYGASSEDVARTCHAHPTLSEAVKEACLAAYDKPIHF
jgi:dihydrolipoamide dehydrogenase